MQITPFYKTLPYAPSAYVKSYDNETKWMYSLIDDNFLEHYNKIWSGVCKSIKRELDSDPIYNKKFIKPKITSGKNPTDFHVKDAPEVGFNHICITIMSTDSILEKHGNY